MKKFKNHLKKLLNEYFLILKEILSGSRDKYTNGYYYLSSKSIKKQV